MVDTTDRGEISSQTLDSHLKYIREIIVKEAIALSDKNRTEENQPSGSVVPREQDIWVAALKYAPGTPFPPRDEGHSPRFFSFGGWSNTGVLAALTFVFGILGLIGIGLIGSAPPGSEAAKSLGPFLDIAKIFAGAIVGAAGAHGRSVEARWRLIAR
jgi:hypothetical protein